MEENIMKKEEQIIKFPYTPAVEKNMKKFYNSLNEKDKRHYAALEANKLCYGGITYISELLGCDRSTIQNGIEEFKKK
jgi:hypothetical protein